MMRMLYRLLLGGYTLLVAYWMLFAFGRRVGTDYMYNLVPFQTIKLYLDIDKFNTSTWIINLLGNVGVFMPFGVLIPIVFRCRYGRSLGIFTLWIVILELVQLLTKRGSLDTDDYLLNALGFTIGYGGYKLVSAFYEKIMKKQ